MHPMLNILGLSDHDAEKVVNMMSEPHRFYHTVTHVLSVIGNSPDPMIWALGWFHDVIYDTAPKRYYTYRSQIRSEYIHVPWEVYATARADILSGFNDRQIFYTREFSDKEPIAHQNIEREIDDLRYCDELDFLGMFL